MYTVLLYAISSKFKQMFESLNTVLDDVEHTNTQLIYLADCREEENKQQCGKFSFGSSH